MPFVKSIKNKAFFKRYQVKYKRRREGKTDYYARKRLVVNDKNKYNTPKYRLCARFTNKYVICQVIYADTQGDKVLASAYSKELKRYGLKAGFKNYPAAYCTGLLCGRRLLKKIGLFEQYTGVGDDEEDEVTGEIMSVQASKKKTYFVDELDDDRRPFRCYLDVGLKRTTLGAKVFGALKGASDAGLDIPHNHKKFLGYNAEEKEYDASVHRGQIFGEPIMEYMESLQTEDEENGTDNFKKQFGAYAAAGVGPEDLEPMYLAVHKAIRENPDPVHAESSRVRAAKKGQDTKYQKGIKRSKADRDAAVAAKKAALAEESSSEEESDDDDDEESDE